jgi:hypothetical protein
LFLRAAGRGRTAVAGPARTFPPWPRPAYGGGVRVNISSDAAELVLATEGKLWVWAARPRMCCSGAPSWMHAALSQPQGLTGFVPVPAGAGQPARLTVYFRAAGGLQPDVLEIAIQGKRRPRVAAYWDGCLMAMTT